MSNWEGRRHSSTRGCASGGGSAKTGDSEGAGPTGDAPPLGPGGERPVPVLVLSVDRGHLVQAVLFGLEPQVGDAVGHVHSLSRVGVGAGGRVGRHGAGGGGGETEGQLDGRRQRAGAPREPPQL